MDGFLGLVFGAVLLVLWQRVSGRVKVDRVEFLEREIRDLQRDQAALSAELERMQQRLRTPPPPVAVPAPIEVEPSAVPAATLPESRSPAPPVSEGNRTLEEVLDAVAVASQPPEKTQDSPPPPPIEPVAPPTPDAPPIEWERWLGVRGAAVLGGLVLAVAGLYFFKYSIDHGLMSPQVRVLSGLGNGLALIIGADLFLRRKYPVTAHPVMAGGLVALYASIWSSKALYGLVGFAPAFVGMVAVTALACWLAVKRDALVIAVIALLGGFATPLALSTGSDRPLALFAYVLLIDVGFLAVARLRTWPMLGTLAALCTLAIQFLWGGLRMHPDTVWVGLATSATLPWLFVFAPRGLERDDRKPWLTSQGAGVIGSMLFLTRIAAEVDFGAHFWPIAASAAVLLAGARWVAWKQDEPLVARLGTGSALIVFAAWAIRTEWTQALAIEALFCALGLAAVVQAVDEFRGEPGAADHHAWELFAGLSTLLVAFSGEMPVESLLPVAIGLVLLATLAVRNVWACQKPEQFQVVAGALGGGLTLLHWLSGARTGFDGTALLGLFAVVSVVALFVSRGLPDAGRTAALRGTVFLATTLLGGFVNAVVLRSVGGLTAGFVPAALVLVGVLAASSLRSGIAFAGVVTTTLVTQASIGTLLGGSLLSTIFPFHLGTAALLTLWPTLGAGFLVSEPWATRASALAGLVAMPSLLILFNHAYEFPLPGLIPLAIAAVTALAGRRASAVVADEHRRTVQAWYFGVALVALGAFFPIQLENEWITIGWAIQGALVLELWRRVDHAGLKYVGLTLLLAATLRLVANPWAFDYHLRPTWPFVSWILYTWALPCLLLLRGAFLLNQLELKRLREVEKNTYYVNGVAAGTHALTVASALVGLFWVSLTVSNSFHAPTDELLFFGFERQPARDLTLSVSWGLYAIGLLVTGTRLKLVAARWASLALLLGTIGKVFLFDLGQLDDLYRVLSLLGLAASLIAVSLLYQRLVFAPDKATGPDSK